MPKVVNDRTPEMPDVKNFGYEDTKDVEGFDTTEAPKEDAKEVDEVLDTKGKQQFKELKTC
jgi:hypothetical protein